jgi:hypothetical protein
MGGSYRQCTECGKRALSIATRCPGCGREFSGPVVRESGGGLELGRFMTPKLVAGALAAAVVLGLPMLGRSGGSSGKHSLFKADSVGAPSEVGFSAAESAELDTASAAALAAESAGELLVARTWTHVRKSRRVSGELEAVLLPGDTVLADSLSSGWYRVALEGDVLGYVHHSTLVAPGNP